MRDTPFSPPPLMPSQSDTLETLGRAGYAVKGVLYALLGVVALQAAVSGGGNPDGSSGLFQSLADGTFGSILLGLLAVGLGAYALWRLALAALNPHGTAEAGERVYYAVSGLSYGFLAYQAAKLVLGSGGGGSGGGTQERTETLLSQPFGQILVGAVAVIAAGYALRQFQRAYKASFTKKLNLGSLNASAREWAVRAGRAGLAARGVVYAIVSYFLLRAALESSSARAKGLDGVLETLRDSPFGNVLLGAVALGLVGYGVYCWLNARYRVYE